MSWTQKQEKDFWDTYEAFTEESEYLKNERSYALTSKILNRLHRYETTLHRIAELQCSVEMSEREETRIAKKEKATEKRVQEIADRLGFKVRFNGDPRGGAIRIILPSGRSNNWDEETWGIYW